MSKWFLLKGDSSLKFVKKNPFDNARAKVKVDKYLLFLIHPLPPSHLLSVEWPGRVTIIALLMTEVTQSVPVQCWPPKWSTRRLRSLMKTQNNI